MTTANVTGAHLHFEVRGAPYLAALIAPVPAAPSVATRRSRAGEKGAEERWRERIGGIKDIVTKIPDWIAKLKDGRLGPWADHVLTGVRSMGKTVVNWLNEKIPNEIKVPKFPDIPLPDNPIPDLFDTGGEWRHGVLGVNMSGKSETVFTNTDMVQLGASLRATAAMMRNMIVGDGTTGAGAFGGNDAPLIGEVTLMGRPDEYPSMLADVSMELRKIRMEVSMPAVLREHQHELNLPDAVGDGFVFGTEDTGYLTLNRPLSAGGDQRNADRDLPQEDGRGFGTDFRGAKMITYEIGVLTDHLAANGPARHRLNLDYLDGMEVLWNHEKWRETPDSMAMLRACEGGQTWRTYGRPRRYEEVVGKLTASGYSNIVADFAMKESTWYSDQEYSADVSLPTGIENGLVAPLTAPLSTVQGTNGSATIIVGGSKRTWPVVEFTGPVSYPAVQIGSMWVALNMDIAAGQTIRYDPRPWVRSVFRVGDNASYANAIANITPRMPNAYIAPGQYAVTMYGQPTGAGASTRIKWRNARARP